jgi:hypothetical protein
MQHRGVTYEVKPLGDSRSHWRWIVFRNQPLGPTTLGESKGTFEEAVDHCKREIDRGFERIAEKRGGHFVYLYASRSAVPDPSTP